jgi:protocatechuate 3,4-dioxygenase beta subunit
MKQNFIKSSLLVIAFLCSFLFTKAQITGNAFKDFNFNGTKQTTGFPVEVGAAGVEVRAFNAANIQLGPTKVTNYLGAYSFTAAEVPAGTNVRLEFTPQAGIADSRQAGALSTNIRFLQAGAAAVNIDYAVSSPLWYSATANPYVATNAATNGSPLTTATTTSSNNNLFVMPWSLRNAGNTAPAAIGTDIKTATNFNLGAIFGLASQKTSRTIFMAAYLKRHIGFGIGGISGIYTSTIDAAGNPTTPALYVRLVDLGINVGTDPRTGTVPTDGTIRHADPGTFENVGKRGIGGITVSDDGQDLYVVNMFQQKLHRIRIGNPLKATLTAADVIGSYDIPAASGVAANWRPMAATFHEGKVFVGGVQVIEKTTAHNLATDTVGQRVRVLSFSPQTNAFTEVLRYGLNYRKGFSNSDNRFPQRNNWWNAWQNNGSGALSNATIPPPSSVYSNAATPPLINGYNNTTAAGAVYNGGVYYSQPLLADLEFDVDGSMVLGIRDRNGDQMGYNQPGSDDRPSAPLGFGQYANPAASITFFRGLNGGEILRAGKNFTDANYTLENRGQYSSNGSPVYGVLDRTAPNLPAAAGSNWGNGSTLNSVNVPWAYGKFGPSNTLTVDAASPANGPASFNQGGYFYANQNTSGNYYDGVTPIPNLNGSAGGINAHYLKSNGGLALLHGSEELMSTLMDPVNATFTQGTMKAWNHVEDPAKLTGTATNTNIDGNMSQRIQLTLTTTAANGDAGSPLNSGKANGMGDLEIINNFQPIEIGNRLWIDDNADGIQDANEITNPGGILSNVAITLRSPGPDGDFATTADNQTWTTTTNTNGEYYFNSLTPADTRRPATWSGVAATSILPGFTYRIEAPIPTNYKISTANVATNTKDKIDNDATRLNVAGTDVAAITLQAYVTDHNFDIGYNGVALLGDFVWRDDNKNGIQDAGEPGVSGVSVTLFQNGADGIPNTNDDVVKASTTTDAYGKYLFDNLTPSTVGDNSTLYNVAFTQPANYIFTTQTNTTSAVGADNTATGGSTTANGSDVGSDGVSGGYFLSLGEAERKVDAGIYPNDLIPTASIGDKVWFDADGNGKQDPSELGVSGITVTLYDNAGNVIAITRTNSEGTYIFDNLVPGTYTVGFAILPGTKFTTQNAAGTTTANNSDVDPTTRRTAPISVAAGQKITDIDAGLVADPRCALGDYVWNDVNRDGLQGSPQDEPGVPNVTMRLYNSANVLQATTTTDVFGVYLFPDLASGDYRVEADIPANYQSTSANAGTNDRNDSDFPAAQTGTVSVLNGAATTYNLNAVSPFSTNTKLRQDMTLDLGIRSTIATNGTLNQIGNIVWRDVNQNGTQDAVATEPGVANVNVQLLSGTGTPIINPTAPGQPYITRTANDGTYRFVDLPDGTYRVKFTNIPSGFQITTANASGTQVTPINGTESNTDSDASPSSGETANIDLDNAGSNSVGVIYDNIDAGIFQGNPFRKGSLGDRVWYDLNTNGVQDAGELGADVIRAELYKETTPGSGIYAYQAVRYTDALGRYIFGALDAANYMVAFSEVRAGFTVTGRDLGGNDAADSDANPTAGTLPAGATSVSGAPAGAFTRHYSNIVALGQGNDNLTVDMGLVSPATRPNTIGDKVFWDNGQGGGTAKDGIQNGTEPGVQGIEAILLNAAGQTVDKTGVVTTTDAYVTTTDANGNYLFTGLPDGTFKVLFRNFPTGFTLTNADASTETLGTDSDADIVSGVTIPTFTLGTANRNERFADAGLISDKAALGDRVWLDNNGNGLQDAGENGISGATVTLFAANGSTVIATAITDDQGNYFFQNLDPGSYVVGFTTLPQGIPFTTQVSAGDNQNNNNSDASPLTGKTGVIVLSAGEVDRTIDAGLAPVLPARVGNFVWIDEDKDGVQDATEPGVPGVIATLYNASGDPVGVGITDGRGTYNITDVAPGNGYYVVFTNTTGFTFTQPLSTLPGGNTSTDSDPTISGVTPSFNLAPGAANTTIDAGLLRPARLGDFVWLDNNQNGRQDAGEPGVGGITVTLYANGTDGAPATDDDIVLSSTITDAYGKYQFEDLPASSIAAGIYNVQFTLPSNYQFTTQTNSQNTTGTATTVTGAATSAADGSDANPANGRTGGFFLNNGDAETGVDAGIIFVQPTTPILSSIGDKVWLDNNTNGIQDGNEPGVAGVNVGLEREVTPGVWQLFLATTTDGNGNYIFNDLPNATYRVVFTPRPGTVFTTRDAAGSTDNNDSDVDPTTNRTIPVTISAAGTVITNIDAGLRLVDNTKAEIGNRVWLDVDRDGIQSPGEVGIANVTVQLLAEDKTTVLRTTTTDAYGFYIFSELNPSVAPGGPTPATNGYYVRFVGTSPALAGLYMTEANVGDLIPGIGDDVDSDPTRTTGLSTGYFLSPGERNMSVDAGYYSNQDINTIASVGDRVWHDLNADGREDANEPGMPGVRVVLLAADGVTVVATTYTDEFGYYVFNGLTPNTYSVQFTNLPPNFGFTAKDNVLGNDNNDSDADVFSGKTVPFTLVGGENRRNVDAGITKFTSAGLAHIGNKVWYDLNGDGKQEPTELGVAGVTVNLYRDANLNGVIDAAELTAVSTQRTNALGEYMFGGLTPGCYQVSFANLPVTGPTALTLSPKTAAGVDGAANSDGNALNTTVAGQPANATSAHTDLVCIKQGEENLTIDLGLVPAANTNTLGDKVWIDLNNDNSLSANEPGIRGVIVTLLNSAGAPIATTTTDANGNYLFANLPDGDYSVAFRGLPSGFSFVTKSVSNDLVGSDADPLSGATEKVTLNASNRNDRSLDAGVKTTTAGLGNYVWVDKNDNGVQDATEPSLSGVTVNLYRPNYGLNGITGDADDALPVASMITDENGFYFFPNLVPNTAAANDQYQVEFSTIPLNGIYTKRNTPGDNKDNTNNDAVPTGDPRVGRTGNIKLDVSEFDLTIDAGITNEKPNSIGSIVFSDLNFDGQQGGPNEIGIPGVVVTLFNSANQPIASTTTDGAGQWRLGNLVPGTGYYVTFSPNLPNFNAGGAAPTFTIGATDAANALSSGTESDTDSDVAPNTAIGTSGSFTIANGDNFPNIDAGIINWGLRFLVPIQLVDFKANPLGSNVNINWVVANEAGVIKYEVEHSIDGRRFETFTTANPNGARNYGATHRATVAGVNYYRLKVTEANGVVTYSTIRRVNFSMQVNDVKVYPVPAQNNITLSIPSAIVYKPATIAILSTDGKVVYNKTVTALNANEYIPVSNLANGQYVLRLTINNEVVVKQIQIIR